MSDVVEEGVEKAWGGVNHGRYCDVLAHGKYYGGTRNHIVKGRKGESWTMLISTLFVNFNRVPGMIRF